MAGHFWTIAIAAIGFGAGGEGIRQYQLWKSRRRDRPVEVRNAGFWTDKRIIWSEALLVFAALSPFFAMIAMFQFPNFWKAAIVLFIYAASGFSIMRGLNRYQGP